MTCTSRAGSTAFLNFIAMSVHHQHLDHVLQLKRQQLDLS
jgi:hypothetical protein